MIKIKKNGKTEATQGGLRTVILITRFFFPPLLEFELQI